MNGNLSSQYSTDTQVQSKELTKGQFSTSIGIPKEITFQENRVPLTPSAVQYIVSQGIEIKVQSGCGENANFSDHQYSEAGAQIVSQPEIIYESDIILKIDPPTEAEIDLMKSSQLLISALQINQLEEILLRKLQNKKITALAYEFIQDDSGALPIIRAMSEIAGTASILIAAEYLNNTHIGKGELLGGFAGVPPTQVVVIGAGAVGEYATKAALGLGANVKIFDNNIYRLRRIQKTFGLHLYTSTLQPNVLASSIERADVVIGAYAGSGHRSPMVVSEEMVLKMKPFSIIIDVAIDRGGNFETSEMTNHDNPVFKKHGVLHYCVPNIPSRVSRTASYALSNIFTPMIDQIVKDGGFSNSVRNHSWIRKGTYLFNGNLTNKSLADKFQLKYRDLDLLVGLFN